MKSNYALAVCDILGFSILIQENSLDDVVQVHLRRLRKALHHSIHKGEFPVEAPSLQALQDQSELGLAWFSDTILIYTLEDTDDNLRALTSCLGWLLFETIYARTRLRCGVSYGEAFIDAENSIYVGKPLIEAHRLEQDQVWSGGALSLEAVERLPTYARTGEYVEWFLVPYQVPVKGNGTLETLAIDWTIGVHPPPGLRWSETSAVPPEDEWEKSPDICEKWKNTKLFHDRVCRSCRR